MGVISFWDYIFRSKEMIYAHAPCLGHKNELNNSVQKHDPSPEEMEKIKKLKIKDIVKYFH